MLQILGLTLRANRLYQPNTIGRFSPFGLAPFYSAASFTIFHARLGFTVNDACSPPTSPEGESSAPVPLSRFSPLSKLKQVVLFSPVPFPLFRSLSPPLRLQDREAGTLAAIHLIQARH